MGTDRALVSDVAGTTVDPIEAYFDLYFGADVEKYERPEAKPKHNKEIKAEGPLHLKHLKMNSKRCCLKSLLL